MRVTPDNAHLVLIRRGTREDWLRQDPVLGYNEPGGETDHGGVKLGDGKTPWSDLRYLIPPQVGGRAWITEGLNIGGYKWRGEGRAIE